MAGAEMALVSHKPSPPVHTNTAALTSAYIPAQARQNPLPAIKPAQSKPLSQDKFGHALVLLEQRYVITQSSQGSMIIDLQQAEQQLRRQQLQHAIDTNTLSSRPILVPLSVPIDNDLIELATQHKALLADIGLQLDPQPKALLIKSIPSLLAQTDLKVLVKSLLTSLKNNQTDKNLLVVILQQQLPILAISQLEQASQLLRQLNHFADDVPWCRRLDHQTLNGLF
jgi:DNA mismatch repair protein MutL